MKPLYRETLAKNVQGLMDHSPVLRTHKALAKKCSTPNRKIGARTIGHVVDGDGPQTRLDTIVAIAEAFGVTPMALLSPYFDPATKTEPNIPPPDVLDLAKAITELPTERQQLLFDIFKRDPIATPVPSGIPLPNTVHEPGRRYPSKAEHKK